MKRLFNALSLLLLAAILMSCLGGCGSDSEPATPSTTAPPAVADPVDYASQLQLNMQSYTAKQKVTVKNFIDGDTVHFYVPTSVNPTGVLKARFLAINTPESTGKIEPYGKAASRFTESVLSQKDISIIIESDSATWNLDSTGDRHLVWVWYKTPDMAEYRNLNLEILQSGYAIASNTQGNIYGSICTDALRQAQALKLNVFSGQKDPEFYEGPAVELTLKELRTNIESYENILVAFNCVVTSNNSNTIYVEQYDAETDTYYGMAVYYGNSGLTGEGLQILNIGNEIRLVGKVQYYKMGGTWQIAGLKYRLMKPDDPENIQLISSGHSGAYPLTDAETFVNGTKELLVLNSETQQEEMVSFPYAALSIHSTLEMKNLTVVDAYTTDNDGSSSNGAMTLTCKVGELTVTVRTAVLRDSNGSLITQETYLGKTIDVKGIIDCYEGEYQIKVFSPEQIVIH